MMRKSMSKLMTSAMVVALTLGIISQSVFAAPSVNSQNEGFDEISTKGPKIISTAIKSTDEDWLVLGAEGISKGAAEYTSIALNNDDVPYVAYVDAGPSKKLSVKKFTGNSWEIVGNEGFSAKKVKDASIVFDKSNTPYVVYIEEGKGKIVVNKLVNNKWKTVGTYVGYGEDVSIAIDSKGTPYVAYTYSEKNIPLPIKHMNGLVVSKFEKGIWKNEYNSGILLKNNKFSDPSIVFDDKDNPYVAFNNKGINVIKRSGKIWKNYYLLCCNKKGDVKHISLAIDDDRNPFVAFIGSNGKATVSKPSKGKSWEISKGKAEYTSIVIDSKGTPYVTYADGKNGGKAVVKKYEDGSWNTVGKEGFSKKKVKYTSIAVDSNGNLFVACQDDANHKKATVYTYTKDSEKQTADLTIKYDGKGIVTGWEDGETKSFEIGTEITLTALADEDSVFMYWKNSEDQVVSTEPEYTFEIGSDETLTVYFSEKSSYLVTFKDGNGEIIETVSLREGDEVVFPEAPEMLGYKFVGWDKSAEEIKAAKEDIVVTALYEKIAQTVTLDVYGGTGSGEYSIRDYVVVVANQPVDGQKFAYWEDQQGNILSYSRSYGFNILRNLKLSAVYVPKSESVDIQARIAITSITKTEEKITFVAERVVPHGNTVVSHGIIVTNNSSIGSSETDFVVDQLDVLNASATTKGLVGIFVLNKTALFEETWYARGYVIYEDSEGNVFTIYSKIVEETIN